MTIFQLDEGESFDGTAWDRIKEQALIELTYVAEDMGRVMAESCNSRTRVTGQAYMDLADAATRLRVMRHGNDRIREQAET